MESTTSHSSSDDLPAAEYEALDLSFDDIPPIPAADPTVFVKPAKAGDAAATSSADAGSDDEAYILGTLLVRVVAARDLPAVRGRGLVLPWIGQTGGGGGGGKEVNPYASVRLGATTQRTTTVRGNRDPIWPRQEFLYMDVTHPFMEEEGEAMETQPHDGAAAAAKSLPVTKAHPRLPPLKPVSVAATATAPSMLAKPSVTKAPPRQTLASSSSVCPVDAADRLVLPESPILTVALFHAAAASSQQKYNPIKQQGDSDDVFIGMTSLDVTTLLTGKERCLDDWWPLQGSNTKSASVRIVVEYEPSDAAPKTGDRVRLTRYCHPADLYPLRPQAIYTVQEVDGDEVTIGATSPEGWLTTVLVRRHMLVCQERHVGLNEAAAAEWATLGERLGRSPLLQVVQGNVSRVPDEGLVVVGQEALGHAQSLLQRWLQGGLGTAVADVRHATNWDGHSMPTVEESLDLPSPPEVVLDDSTILAVEDEEEEEVDARNRSDILPNMPFCPISQEPMRDPVVAADGHTYERAAIARWLQTSDKSPLTGGVLAHKELVPNYMLLSSLREAAAASNEAAFLGPRVDAETSTPPLVDEEEVEGLRDEAVE
jgi:hypothetical protein